MASSKLFVGERQTLVFQTANDTARAQHSLSSLETLAVSVQGGNRNVQALELNGRDLNAVDLIL